MARPTITTPVETTVAVLQSMSNWADRYSDETETIFGDDYDAKGLAEQLADDLEQREETYVREKREDVGLTNRREDIVEKTQKLVSSGTALATIVFGEVSNLDDVLRDFAAGPPSHIRSPQAARKALTRLKAALEIHDEPMSETLANLDDINQQVSDTIAELDEVSATDATETAETKSAQRQRDELRRQAVNFIRNMQLAAEALEFMQPNALEDLHAIFDTHMPRRRPTVREEDLLEGLDNDPQAPTADEDAPTPAADDADVDADADTDTREPSEA